MRRLSKSSHANCKQENEEPSLHSPRPINDSTLQLALEALGQQAEAVCSPLIAYNIPVTTLAALVEGVALHLIATKGLVIAYEAYVNATKVGSTGMCRMHPPIPPMHARGTPPTCLHFALRMRAAYFSRELHLKCTA